TEGALTTQATLQRTAHPVLLAQAEERAQNIQNRIADRITTFAGSMPFVYIHLIWFTVWIAARVEDFPFGFLTMLVSLEAIFLSTFVMISQNRADAKRQALADHQWEIVQLEKVQNDELLNIVQLERSQNEEIIDLTKKILELTTEVHGLASKVHDLVQGKET